MDEQIERVIQQKITNVNSQIEKLDLQIKFISNDKLKLENSLNYLMGLYHALKVYKNEEEIEKVIDKMLKET